MTTDSVSRDNQKSHRQPVTRRTFLRGCAIVAAAGAATSLGGLYAWRVEPNWLDVTSRDIPVAHLPPELDGLTIAHLSDLHVGPLVEPEFVGRAVDLANGLDPDIVVITGDFVTWSADFAKSAAQQLSRLTSRYGVYGVLGNHDVWADPDRVAQVHEALGIKMLRDEAVGIDAGTSRLWLVGLEDAGYSCYGGRNADTFDREWAPKVRVVDDILAPLDEMPRILLVHNPDMNDLLSGRRIDLALSGHTHGGQVRLPVVGAPYLPSCRGQKYAGGLAAGPGWPVFVSRGVGMTGIPVRLNCRPEIGFLTLRAEAGSQT